MGIKKQSVDRPNSITYVSNNRRINTLPNNNSQDEIFYKDINEVGLRKQYLIDFHIVKYIKSN